MPHPSPELSRAYAAEAAAWKAVAEHLPGTALFDAGLWAEWVTTVRAANALIDGTKVEPIALTLARARQSGPASAPH